MKRLRDGAPIVLTLLPSGHRIEGIFRYVHGETDGINIAGRSQGEKKELLEGNLFFPWSSIVSVWWHPTQEYEFDRLTGPVSDLGEP